MQESLLLCCVYFKSEIYEVVLCVLQRTIDTYQPYVNSRVTTMTDINGKHFALIFEKMKPSHENRTDNERSFVFWIHHGGSTKIKLREETRHLNRQNYFF